MRPSKALIQAVVLSTTAAAVLVPLLARPAGSQTLPMATASQLDAAQQTLVTNNKWLEKQGVYVDKVVVDQASHHLLVGVSPQSVTSAEHLVQDMVPGVPVALQHIKVLSASAVADYTAGPPWLTGMNLYKLFYQGSGLYYTECTAGFNVINPKTHQVYVTTAAHCFNPGDTILHSTGNTGQTVGAVGASAGFGSIADSELITPRVASVPNTIIVGNSTERAVSAYYPLTATGTSLCKSGITTGEICGNVVTSTNATVCYSSGCFYNQEETRNSAVSEVAYYGDSGGPVYKYTASGSVIAAGSLSGFEEICGASGAGCSLDGVMFFTPIRNLQQTLGVVP